MTKCKSCGREYEYDRFKGHRVTVCNSCTVNLRRFRVKERALEYMGGKCVRCGYSRNKAALQFHHSDPKEKAFQISGAHARKWESIRLELEKCVLLCANCHIEDHNPEAAS